MVDLEAAERCNAEIRAFLRQVKNSEPTEERLISGPVMRGSALPM
jgi:hypothetical protein